MMAPQLNLTDIRDQYIARVVQGKTFAEVGGLWGTVSEKVSVAKQFGATELTMIDAASMTEHQYLWQAFHDRMVSLDIDKYHCLSLDICDIQIEEIGQPYDVVHCAGVLYHHPHPMQMLVALRKITGQYLVLTSAITQEVIENEKGRYEIPSSGVMFVPALNDSEREILTVYWEQFMIKERGMAVMGITQTADYNLNNFAPWWWLPTAHALRSMCEVAGFNVLDSGLTWHNNALSLLLSV
jgi:hypothetical protein